MAGRIADFIIRLLTQDEASEVIEDVADTAEALDGTSVEVPVEAEGGEESAEAIEGVGEAADEVDGKSVDVPVATPGAEESKESLLSLGGAAELMESAGFSGAAGIAALSASSLGAATAIGGVAVVAKKSLDAFVDLGTSAHDTALAVGLTTEEYSRWVAVADDSRVSATELNSAFSLLSRELAAGGEDLAKYGIATHDVNGELRSTSDVMLDVVGTLNAIEDPSARAIAGTELLGRGYKNLAPLVNKTEEEMRGYLATVSAGQVITDEEAQKAIEMAEAQDQLRDALQDVVLAVGQMLVSLTPLVELTAKLVETVASAMGPLTEFADTLSVAGEMARAAVPEMSGLLDVMGMTKPVSEEAARGILGLNEATEDFTKTTGRSAIEMFKEVDALKASSLGVLEKVAALESMGATADQVAVFMEHLGITQEDVTNATADSVIEAIKLASATGEVGDAALDAEQAQAKFVDALEAEVVALNESIAASEAKADAMRASSDAEFAALQSSIAFTDTVAGLSSALEDAGGNSEKVTLAWMELGRSADKAADDAVTAARGFATAAGATLSAADELSIWNSEMLKMARESPLAADAIMDVVAAQNEVAPETITEVMALVDQGKLAEAVAVLDAASAQRDTLISISTDTAAIAEADALIQRILGDPVVMPLDADPDAALGTILTVEQRAALSDAAIHLGADSSEAEGAIEDLTAGDYEAFLELVANLKPAEKAIDGLVETERTTTVDAEAETRSADTDLLALMSQSRLAAIVAHVPNWTVVNGMLNDLARKRTATITADANTSAAEKELNHVARTRTARINASVSRSNVLVRVDGGG